MGLQIAQLGQPRRHGHGIPGGSPPGRRSAGSHLLHQRPAGAVGPHGHPAADDLAEGDDIRPHAEELLGAAQGQAEAGDDLVENEQGPVFVAEGAQAPRKPGAGPTTPMLAATGSTMTAATSPAVLIQQDLHAVRSLNWAVSVSFAAPHRHARGEEGAPPGRRTRR